MTSNHKHIILFDGVCNLCNGVVKFIIKRDKDAKFKFAALQSFAAQDLLKRYHLPTDTLDTFIYIRNNVAFKRSSAALYLFNDLGGIYKLLFVGIIVPKIIRDLFYRISARSRYSIWGRRDSCMIPTEDIKSRFLD
mgnify:CR=1 FL=1